MDYITCEKRKNAPQINVLICEKKCKQADTCGAYLNYAKLKSLTASLNGCPPPDGELLVVTESPEQHAPYAADK